MEASPRDLILASLGMRWYENVHCLGFWVLSDQNQVYGFLGAVDCCPMRGIWLCVSAPQEQ